MRSPACAAAWLVALAAALLAAACGGADEPPAGDGPSFPLPPQELERRLRTEPFEIRSQQWTAGWTWPVHRIEAWFPSIDRTLTLKWKAAPDELERRNNTPRREIAAYRIQQWFVGPDAYVVPTTLGRCIPLTVYAAIDPDAEPNVPGARCVFGALSIWLENVVEPDPLLDEAHFAADPDYARHLAHYNLLTYLIENRDTRPANVLVSADRSQRRVFSIDNGVSFGEPLYNALRSHWNEIRVPALSRDAVERLRGVGDDELDALAVVAQFRADVDGVLREVPASEPIDRASGVRLRDGVLQLGLTAEEIQHLRERLRALLAAVDAGEIRLF